jgi:tellurite resistance protein TehA-like permease
VKFLLSYSTRPIHIFGMIGLGCGFLGFLLGLWLSFQRLVLMIPLANRPMLLLSILLVFIGVQFITIGLLAELQTRIYHEAQDKPTYAVRETVGL